MKQDQEQINEQQHLQAATTELLQPLSGAKQQGDQRTQHDNKEQPLQENRESSPSRPLCASIFVIETAKNVSLVPPRPPVIDESAQKARRLFVGLFVCFRHRLAVVNFLRRSKCCKICKKWFLKVQRSELTPVFSCNSFNVRNVFVKKINHNQLLNNDFVYKIFFFKPGFQKMS